MEKKLTGKVALVTGGSRGIGRAICVDLAKQGAFVWVNYASRPDAAEKTVELCREAGGHAAAIQFLVGDSAQVDAAVDSIKEKSGRLDILVNNAGISKDGLFVRMKNEDWSDTIETNLTGSFNCSRAASKLMMKQRWGRIVTISSVVGEMGNAGQVPYVASKAGLIGMTKAIARELASRSVTANAIAPGFIETDMTDALGDEVKEHHKAAIPLGRFGKAEEVSSLVSFLCSEQAGYITGQVIGVNGGMYM
jgi:3-oxoacyl-[acyl-carrier protein] reductase